MTTDDQTLPALQGWALVLGASSGFGAACSLALAKAGMSIVGVHLDRRATRPNADRLVEQIQGLGREAWFFNVNAADVEKRGEVVRTVSGRFAERGRGEKVRVVLHSLAFGALKPFFGEEPLTQKQMDMTLDVMANSLVYWVQDLVKSDLLEQGGRVLAMTSTGATLAWHGYGAVSAAKGALECHVRQLGRELAPLRITANAVCAGVTETAASVKIPEYEGMSRAARQKNPYDRLTRVEDVANAVVALAHPCTYWINGNVIYVDGGEAHCG